MLYDHRGSNLRLRHIFAQEQGEEQQQPFVSQPQVLEQDTQVKRACKNLERIFIGEQCIHICIISHSPGAGSGAGAAFCVAAVVGSFSAGVAVTSSASSLFSLLMASISRCCSIAFRPLVERPRFLSSFRRSTTYSNARNTYLNIRISFEEVNNQSNPRINKLARNK